MLNFNAQGQGCARPEQENAPAVEGAKEKRVQANFNAACSHAVNHYIEGQRDAEAFLVALRSTIGDGEELSTYLIRKLKGQPNVWLKGFCRSLQKAIEGGRDGR